MAKFVFTYQAPSIETSVAIAAKHQEDLVAPMQIWLRAKDYVGLAGFEETGEHYDGAHHEYYHEWVIDGEPLADWTKPQNLLPEHNNPNKAYGREVAFCLPVAGDYTISLLVKDRLGNVAVAFTETYTIADKLDHFPEADRIYVDDTGVFTDVPAASAKVADLAALYTTMNGRKTNQTLVLLRRGGTFPLTNVNLEHTNDNYKGMLVFEDNTEVRMIADYGNPLDPQPKITPATRADRNYTRTMFELRKPKTGYWRTITSVTFEGAYDPERERGFGAYASGPSAENWEIPGGGGFSLFHNLNVSGIDKGYRPGGDKFGNPHHHMIVDCGCDGWRDFASLGGQPGQRLAFVGCSFVQKPNVPNYGDKDDVRNTHGPIRVSNCAYVYVSQMDLFSRNHWDGSDQPCLRLFTEPEALQGAVVERCSMEGGYEVIHMINSENTPIYPANILLEKLLLIGGAYTAAFVSSQRSGITFRDSICIRHNVPAITAQGNGGFVNLLKTGQAEDEQPGVYTQPVVVHGITAINLLDDTNDGSTPHPFLTSDAAYTSLVDENNIYHRPNAATPVVPFAPIDLATPVAGFTGRYLGRRFNFQYPTVVLDSDIADGQPLSVPYSEFGTGLYDGLNTPISGSTDQAYWQALVGIDDEHMLALDPENEWTPQLGGRRYSAEVGHISVAFTETHVVITNNTGETWATGRTARVWLDRSSLMPSMESQYAHPEEVPLPRPQTGSAAIGAATSGRVSPKDFFLVDRGATPSKGALEPAA